MNSIRIVLPMVALLLVVIDWTTSLPLPNELTRNVMREGIRDNLREEIIDDLRSSQYGGGWYGGNYGGYRPYYGRK